MYLYICPVFHFTTYGSMLLLNMYSSSAHVVRVKAKIAIYKQFSSYMFLLYLMIYIFRDFNFIIKLGHTGIKHQVEFFLYVVSAQVITFMKLCACTCYKVGRHVFKTCTQLNSFSRISNP